MTEHILDLQWSYKRTFGLYDPPTFWYKGHGYYSGIEHDDGEVYKISHLIRDPCDMLIGVSGPSAYNMMTFEQFKKEVDDLY
ncbi:MAG: hypothetical protein KAJ19_02905 [Gammaproteobacteria bacterium]|nr:hypothetical protein [Gammaproteobacteria bacterium]